jgi:hypothetical protein
MPEAVVLPIETWQNFYVIDILGGIRCFRVKRGGLGCRDRCTELVSKNAFILIGVFGFMMGAVSPLQRQSGLGASGILVVNRVSSA